MPAAEASTFGIAFPTVYENVILSGDITRHQGKWIYIAGAGGGLGHIAVQMARIHGLKVIGSAGKSTTIDLLGRLGVDHIIDYSQQDVAQEILKLTNGRGVDVVHDSTGSLSSFQQSSAVIAPGGEYIRLGTPMQLKQFGKPDLSSVVEAEEAQWSSQSLADMPRIRNSRPRKRERVFFTAWSRLSDGPRKGSSSTRLNRAFYT